jgi:hypothetical protein
MIGALLIGMGCLLVINSHEFIGFVMIVLGALD